MPTSSQALIIKKKCSEKSSSQPSRTLKPCPVSNIDISDLFSQESDLLETGERLFLDGYLNIEESRNTSQVYSEINMRGFQTILLYDKVADSFRWKFLPQKDENPKVATKVVNSNNVESDLRRPQSCFASFNNKETEKNKTGSSLQTKKSVTFAKPLHYNCLNKSDGLACFGLKMDVPKSNIDDSNKAMCSTKSSTTTGSVVFNPPSILKTTSSRKTTIEKNRSSPNVQAKRGQCINTNKLKRGKSAPIFKGSVGENSIAAKRPPKESADAKLWIHLPNQIALKEKGAVLSNTEENDFMDRAREDALEKFHLAEAELKQEEIRDGMRITPTLDLRKELPGKRPCDIIFSLRDNEEMSHLEMKSFIAEQTGVVPRAMQYDPLSIRSRANNMRSRWVVSTSNKEACEQLLHSGLRHHEDFIVPFPFDQIAEREHRAYLLWKDTIKEQWNRKCLADKKVCKPKIVKQKSLGCR